MIEVICNGCDLVQVIDEHGTACPECGSTSFTFRRFVDDDCECEIKEVSNEEVLL